MAVRQDEVQLKIAFITDESRAYARLVLENKAFISDLQKAQKEGKSLDGIIRQMAESGKKVENLDLSKLAPAQLIERAKQLSQAMRLIPQSAPEFRQLQGELSRVNGQLRQINETAKGISAEKGGGLLQRILGVAGGLGVFELAKNAINSLVNFGRQALAEADAQLKADAQIKEAIRSTGGVAGKSLAELKQQAEELQKVTLFGDEQTEGAQALLLTFKNIRGEIFDETVPLVQDFATAFKQDLSSSAIQVGKALEDPVKGVTALRRVGITFSEDQRKMIKALVETGDVAGAQRVILKELETQVGGSARAAAEAGAGPFQLLKNQFGEIKEAVGQLLINGLKPFLPAIQSITESIQEFVSTPLSDVLREQQSDFNALLKVVGDTTVKEEQRTAALKQLKAQYPEYLRFVNDDTAGQLDLAKTLEVGNKLFEQRIFLQAGEEQRTKLIKDRLELEGKLTQQLKDKARAENDIAKGAGTLTSTTTTFGGGIAGGTGRQTTAADDLKRGLDAQIQGIKGTEEAIAEVEKAYKEFNATQDETAKRLFGSAEAAKEVQAGLDKLKAGAGAGDGENTPAAKAKKEAEAAQGSLAFLRKQISDLQKELENTPGDSKALAPLVEQLKEAEKRLKELEARLERLKNPQGDIVPTDDEIRAQLGGFSQPDRSPTEDERAAITEFNDFRVEDEEMTTEELNAFRQGLSDKDTARRQKERDEEEEHQNELRKLKFSAAESVSNALFEIQRNQTQQETDDALAALDKEYQAKIAAAEGNSALQAQLQKDLEKKKEAIELEAARKRRALAIKEAVVAGALAVVKALPNPFAAIAAGIAATAQIAIISGQKFARGGYTGSGIGAPDETGYRPAGIVHEGEYVIPKRVVQNAAAAPVLRWLEGKRLRGYADGGLVTVNTTPTALPAVPVQATAALANMDMFVAAVAQFTATVAQFPTEVKSRVVVTELETAQAELAGVRADAAN